MRTTRCAGLRGFTLVELMVVIVILGGLITLVGPNVFGSLKYADQNRARHQMKHLEGALRMYYLRNRHLPASLEDLKAVDPETGEAWMHQIPLDPWGTPYVYRAQGGPAFLLFSCGDDRQEGTEDDVRGPPYADA